tara:strand:+ start:6848 stop:8056 length:1209 start_codon:yes stop_codon:yes gene_type:complete
MTPDVLTWRNSIAKTYQFSHVLKKVLGQCFVPNGRGTFNHVGGFCTPVSCNEGFAVSLSRRACVRTADSCKPNNPAGVKESAMGYYINLYVGTRASNPKGKCFIQECDTSRPFYKNHYDINVTDSLFEACMTKEEADAFDAQKKLNFPKGVPGQKCSVPIKSDLTGTQIADAVGALDVNGVCQIKKCPSSNYHSGTSNGFKSYLKGARCIAYESDDSVISPYADLTRSMFYAPSANFDYYYKSGKICYQGRVTHEDIDGVGFINDNNVCEISSCFISNAKIMNNKCISSSDPRYTECDTWNLDYRSGLITMDECHRRRDQFSRLSVAYQPVCEAKDENNVIRTGRLFGPGNCGDFAKECPAGTHLDRDEKACIRAPGFNVARIPANSAAKGLPVFDGLLSRW